VVRSYLARGLIAGLLASVFAFGFAKVVGEPQIDRAIRIEEQVAASQGEPPSEDVVSRGVQDTVGLGTGVLAAGVALGGLFALAFAFVYQRVLRTSARVASATLAVGALVAVFLVPFLKYPANPPAVGDPDTIGKRTALFFTLLLMSVVAMGLAVAVRHRLIPRLGAWNASLAAAGGYVAFAAVCFVVLPGFNEVPASFPSDLLWRFRLATMGTQVVLWTAIGLIYGVLIERFERQVAADLRADWVAAGR
jgi:hypothetical protein